jgi:hypothetical protein
MARTLMGADMARPKLREFAFLFSALALVAPATAQIAPGMREPETKLDGIRQALEMGCFLAVAGRPFPGINQPLLGMEGEGLKPQSEAPAWLAPFLETEGRNQISLLETPQGPVWITFNHAKRDCRVTAQTAKPNDVRDGLINKLADDIGKWFVTGLSADRIILSKKIDRSAIEWTAVIATPAATPDLVVVTMSASGS